MPHPELSEEDQDEGNDGVLLHLRNVLTFVVPQDRHDHRVDHLPIQHRPHDEQVVGHVFVLGGDLVDICAIQGRSAAPKHESVQQPHNHEYHHLCPLAGEHDNQFGGLLEDQQAHNSEDYQTALEFREA
eukprot:CAMPEP_0116939114 /NCGR_PEP_ID=MMETSP0467-20121206/32540_1 /TAXON_ID=283647 /ORGANISM="Mesodinium pulex, Strain SPMC105" /LENGTH=128 /DNA_ID=CAMNT_0004621325 /DNA_START=825 /DNA_END=1210 /DNA_ORIENTATION=-